MPADPKNAFTVYRKMVKNTVKPLDYTRLKRYYRHMETRLAQFQHPTQKENIMETEVGVNNGIDLREAFKQTLTSIVKQYIG
ncbi:hypothetical protein KC220_23795, partial [Mycobacterium tuberculosis]|nr:hypothetical protein [Mycobacterium tuberculosis]